MTSKTHFCLRPQPGEVETQRLLRHAKAQFSVGAVGYWCGVLGELYGGAVESRMANDVAELLEWFDDESKVPRTVADSNFSPDRLDKLQSRLSAAYMRPDLLRSEACNCWRTPHGPHGIE